MVKGLLIIAVVAILGFGAFGLFGDLIGAPDIKNSVDISAADVVIRKNSEGYSPNNVEIKKGQTVVWVNEDSEFHWPASNLHPTHALYPEFDPGEPLAPGEAWSFTFERTGSWRFHDHLKSSKTGIITVIE